MNSKKTKGGEIPALRSHPAVVLMHHITRHRIGQRSMNSDSGGPTQRGSNRKTVHGTCTLPGPLHSSRCPRLSLVQISIGFHIPAMNEPRLDWLQLWNVYGLKQKPEGGPLTPAVNSGRKGTTKVWWGSTEPAKSVSLFFNFGPRWIGW